ncbi:MAG: discoidin domain-containing protein, partial [Flavisolibacter sp.]
TPYSKYVKGTKLNTKLHNKNYLLHSDVIKGGVFEFSLTETADKKWGSTENVLPSSVINDEQILPVPYFDVKNNKFKDEISVSIKSLDTNAVIYWGVDGIDSSTSYEGPIVLNSSTTIRAFVMKGNRVSNTITQRFYKVPSDKSITVLSQVNPMYTGGGPEALIDEITGNSNWRTGDWHSYYGQDFEAIIDLQENKSLKYVGIHVLQDPSPWILYPKELIIYASDDGENFTEIKRVANSKNQNIETIEIMHMGGEVEVKTRYIKVKAVNAGKLPAWHESAGNPSHLFIDEIIVSPIGRKTVKISH